MAIKTIRYTIYACLLLIIAPLRTVAYTLSIDNGSGSGSYAVGDTVHIWADNAPSGQLFARWRGNIATILDIAEWHTVLVMPAADLHIVATYRPFVTPTLQYEQITLASGIAKNVYYYFPPNYKGVIFCYHGSGGNAQNWTTALEYRTFVSAAIADTFAVVVTEADEISLQQDLDGDGKLRWQTFPLNTTTNNDIHNIAALIDTLEARQWTTATTHYFAVGMSNGGAFSTSVSFALQFSAASSYCAQMPTALAALTNIPTQWCMARFDGHENVGSAGNAQALANYNTLQSNGICSEYWLHDHSPQYPNRYTRVSGISSTQSGAVYNEFRTQNIVAANDYFLVNADSIGSLMIANPLNFLAILALTPAQRVSVGTQVDVMFADHQFFSDYSHKTLRFFSQLCSPCNYLPITIIGNNIACNGNTYTYAVADNPNLVYYDWTVVGGTIVSGQSTASIQVTWQNNTVGSVWATVGY